MAKDRPLWKEFLAQYEPDLCDARGVAYKPAQRDERREAAYAEFYAAMNQPEEPIADPGDTPIEALEKIQSHVLLTMTPSDARKHQGQLLKLTGDTVLLDRKARIEKQSLATGLQIITELFQQVAAGQVKAGPGWIEATTLPTLSAREQAEVAEDTAEALDGPPTPLSAQRQAV